MDNKSLISTLGLRKTSNLSGSPTFSSFRQNQMKTPLSALVQNSPKLTQAIQQPLYNNQLQQSKSPKMTLLNGKPPAHSHKNSQVDISQLTKLIKQQRQQQDNQTTNQQLQQAQLEEVESSQPGSFISSKNRDFFLLQSQSSNQQLKSNLQQKQLSSSHQDLLNQLATRQAPKPVQQHQQFVNYQSLKEQKNNSKQEEEDEKILDLKTTFSFLYVIGIGGFGKVWKVEMKKTGTIYAMKEMSKALVISKKSVNSVMNERTLLSQLKHLFLVNMHYAFQDRENLYLVMDYMMGGDLRYHIGRMRRFNEETTKFFVACIFVGLEFLHNNNIIQRDIKPENLVLDEDGYVRITDLGIARVMKAENSNDTSGTPGYMAPEVMCRQNHSFAVDYFALGVIAYEFMLGRRPYLGRSRQEIREHILAKQVQIKKGEIPEGWSMEATDFINRLIQRKPANRLGSGGSHEIKLHPWFKGYQWQKLMNKELISPFKPNSHEDNFDQKQIVIEDEENADLIHQNLMLLKDPGIQELFVGYDYSNKVPRTNSTTDVSSNSSNGKNNWMVKQ